MVSDVPLGVLLSGGLDSTAIAALAADTSTRPVTAYTITMREEDAVSEQSADDGHFARLASERLGLDLHEIKISPDIANLLETVSWHLDDPVADPAAILTLMISEAAAPEVTVLLSGHGSDELFGGYRVHLYHRVAELLGHQPGWARATESRLADMLPGLARRLPDRAAPGLLLAAHRASRMVLDHCHEQAEDRYLAFRSAYYFPDGGLTDLLTTDIRATVADEDPSAVHRQAFAEYDDIGFFDRMLQVDLSTYLASNNLAYSDRLSMAASIELRVPFLDDAVADLALSLPESMKLRGLRGKAVLRESLRGVVPNEVLRRRKAGFGAPIRAWLRTDLVPLLNEQLSTAWLKETGLFRPSAVRRLIDEHLSGSADHTYRIWTLLTFALWWRTHVASR
jgi:asparagine synthase (glutamine-hydrolysing)